MPTSEITLYHGSTQERLGQCLTRHEDLYGYVASENLDFSGTLTNNPNAAEKYARIIAREIKGSPLLLIYAFPEEMIKLLGPFKYIDCFLANIYITTLPVRSVDIPDEYFEHGNYARPVAQFMESLDTISFHRIPYQYLQQVYDLTHDIYSGELYDRSSGIS